MEGSHYAPICPVRPITRLHACVLIPALVKPTLCVAQTTKDSPHHHTAPRRFHALSRVHFFHIDPTHLTLSQELPLDTELSTTHTLPVLRSIHYHVFLQRRLEGNGQLWSRSGKAYRWCCG